MRIKRAVNAIKKRRKTLRLAKGYWGSRSKLYRVAKQAVMKSGQYAYTGRKLRKRDFRQLWIVRINAGCRNNNISYSQFMHGLKLANISLDRKVLADLAATDAVAFAKLVEQSKLAALKRYIIDYSLIKDRDVKEVVIWDEYLAYATAFGIPNKVVTKITENWYNLNVNMKTISLMMD